MLNDMLTAISAIPGIELMLCKFRHNHNRLGHKWHCVLGWQDGEDKFEFKRDANTAEEALDLAWTAFNDTCRYGVPEKRVNPQLVEHRPDELLARDGIDF